MKEFAVTVTYADGGDFVHKVRALNKALAMIEGEKASRLYDRATAKIKNTTAKLLKEAVK